MVKHLRLDLIRNLFFNLTIAKVYFAVIYTNQLPKHIQKVILIEQRGKALFVQKPNAKAWAKSKNSIRKKLVLHNILMDNPTQTWERTNATVSYKQKRTFFNPNVDQIFVIFWSQNSPKFLVFPLNQLYLLQCFENYSFVNILYAHTFS